MWAGRCMATLPGWHKSSGLTKKYMRHAIDITFYRLLNMRQSKILALLFACVCSHSPALAQPSNNIGIIMSPSISMAKEAGTPAFNKDYFHISSRPAMLLGFVYNYVPAEKLSLFTGLEYGWHSYNIVQHKFDDSRLGNSSVVVTPVITSLDAMLALGYSWHKICFRLGATYSFAQYENNFYIKNIFKDHVQGSGLDEYYLVTDGSYAFSTFGTYGSISYNWKTKKGRSLEIGIASNYWLQKSPLFHLESLVYNKVYSTDFQARQYNVSLQFIRYFGLGRRSEELN